MSLAAQNMSNDAEKKVAVLACSNPNCNQTFDVSASDCKADGIHSLQAALEAHKQGWKAREGQMLCPACASSTLTVN